MTDEIVALFRNEKMYKMTSSFHYCIIGHVCTANQTRFSIASLPSPKGLWELKPSRCCNMLVISMFLGVQMGFGGGNGRKHSFWVGSNVYHKSAVS